MRHHPTKRKALVYELDQKVVSSYIKTVKACDKLIDAIFSVKCKYSTVKRLHIRGKHYTYIPSDAYQIIKLKYTKK